MDFLKLIEAKRDGGTHTDEELRQLVDGVVTDSIPDYQLAAWLMAVVWRGLDADETLALTGAMAGSGQQLDLSDLPGPVVDKHSSGGVGDKLSLVVCPAAAACGLTVAKMSGRGLGFTGGTLDKLESIPGLTTEMDVADFKAQARNVGLVIAGATDDLAPADKALYALRDVTGTVPSTPLIAASIMSKKLAAGAPAIVLDVKFGAGAFMPKADEARELARTMVDIGAGSGRRIAALLTSMEQPLGQAVGNALEVREALAVLRGEGPADVRRLAVELAAALLTTADPEVDTGAARSRAVAVLDDGSALERFRAMVASQGGQIQALDGGGDGLPEAPVIRPVEASAEGYVAAIDARRIGLAAVSLGAGRQRKGDRVDPAVGIVLKQKVGDRVAPGEPMASVHAPDAEAAARVAAEVAASYTVSAQGSEPPELVADHYQSAVARSATTRS